MVPIGVVGNLCVSGACLARGYAGLRHLTADRFVPNPYSNIPGDRMFHTGDLARFRSDGTLEIVGRKDHQIKLRGFRIDPADIESVLEQHAPVKHCAVSVWGEDESRKQLVAYLVTEEPISSTTIRQYLQTRLPDYMLPSVFIPLPFLPRTPNGKVDRGNLPVPESSRTNLGNAFVAPRSLTETQLARIWEDMLQVHPIGVTDNFFELGGQSLLAMQISNRIQEFFDVPFSVSRVFENPTIGEWAQYISAVSSQGGASQMESDIWPSLEPEEGVL